jgi:hypothetical protein
VYCTGAGIERLTVGKDQTGFINPCTLFFTFAYTIFRCVILTNVLYTYRQNTTVVRDVVYLFIGLRYMFRPMLGHHQALWRYII